MYLAKLSSRGFQTQTNDSELALVLESCGGKLRGQATRAQILWAVLANASKWRDLPTQE